MTVHELDSAMLFIHPLLAIAGYVFIFINTHVLYSNYEKRKRKNFLGLTAWLLTLLGLATGMIWAQTAWGSYWSWDPKEALTLILFLTVSVEAIFQYEGRLKIAKILSISSCILSIITASSSFLLEGLHSFI